MRMGFEPEAPENNTPRLFSAIFLAPSPGSSSTTNAAFPPTGSYHHVLWILGRTGELSWSINIRSKTWLRHGGALWEGIGGLSAQGPLHCASLHHGSGRGSCFPVINENS